MKILFIAQTDPRLTSFGGQQRTNVLWKGLQSVGDVWTVVPVPHKWMEERDDKDRIYKICLERRYSVGWFVQRLISRFLPHLALPIGIRMSKIYEVVAVTPDVCVARTLWVAARFCAWKVAPLFVDVDDTPTVDFKLANPQRRFGLWLLQKWQSWVCTKAKGLWVPDPDQIRGLNHNGAAWLPNIPLGEVTLVNRKEVNPNRLLFLGYLAHRPNVVAVDWFLVNFWAGLKNVFPDLQLDVLGGGLPDGYKGKWRRYPGVELHGFVKDTVPFFAQSLALITPMRIGSGTCIKVVESLARGVPVISTGQGLRGIPECDRVAKNGIYPFAELQEVVAAIRHCVVDLNKQGVLHFSIAKRFTQQAVNGILQNVILDRGRDAQR